MDMYFSFRFSKSRLELIILRILTNRKWLTRKNGTWTQELDCELSLILGNGEEIFWANVDRSLVGDGFVSTRTYNRIADDSA